MAEPTRRDLFGKFLLEKRSATYTCAFCSQQNFAVNVDRGDLDSPTDFRLTAEQGGAHNFHALSCVNCGYTSFFHRNQFLAWLDEREKNDGDK